MGGGRSCAAAGGRGRAVVGHEAGHEVGTAGGRGRAVVGESATRVGSGSSGSSPKGEGGERGPAAERIQVLGGMDCR